MTFPIHFLLCNIVLTGFLGLVLLFRTIFRRHVTADSRRRIWYIWMLALVLPLVPEQLFDPAGLIYKIRDLLPSASSVSGIPAETNDTAITSMQQPLEEAGYHAAQLCLQRVRNPQKETERIVLKTQLKDHGTVCTRP